MLSISLFSGGGGGVPGWTYAAVAGLLIFTFGVTVIGIGEPADLARRTSANGWRGGLGAVLEHRAAIRYLAAVFAFMVGFSAVLPYLTLFIVTDIHQTQQTALLLAAATLVVTAVAAIGFGRIAARTGPKAVLVAGWSLIAIAAIGDS